MSKLFTLTLEVSLLVICFLLATVITAYTCSVTNRTIVESTLNDCVENPYYPLIYKAELNRITFSDGDFDNVQAFGLGSCDKPSVSGSWTKCYPQFNSPTTGQCTPSKCNCVRWSQFVKSMVASCGFFSCSCQNGSSETFYLEEECWNESCGGGGGGNGGGESVCESDFDCYLRGCSECNCVFGQCSEATPILIDVNGDGFDLTDAVHGVNFDLNGDQRAGRVAWMTAGSDDAWLVLDRNGNGKVDDGAELFGNNTPQPASASPNGFIALAEFDKPLNGGNSDGRLGPEDTVLNSLRLWQDANHNGISEASELSQLTAVGLSTIDLNYKEAGRRDQAGNWFRYRAKVTDTHANQLGRWAWDVILVSGP